MSITDNGICPDTHRLGNLSWECENITTKIECKSRGDESSRFFCRLGDDNTSTHPRNNLVAYWEIIGFRYGSNREGGYKSSATLDNLFEEFTVFLGITSINPSSENCCRISVIFQSYFMCNGINSVRSSRDNPISGAYEIRDNKREGLARIGSTFSCSDDREII